MYYIYVLQSLSTQELYIGFTQNPKKRLKTHNKGSNVSTKAGRPWRIIYLEGYLDKQDALGRELFLKSGSGRRYLNKQLAHYFV